MQKGVVIGAGGAVLPCVQVCSPQSYSHSRVRTDTWKDQVNIIIWSPRTTVVTATLLLFVTVTLLLSTIDVADAQQSPSPTDITTVQTSLNDLVTWVQTNPIDPAQQATANDLQTRIANLTSDQMATVAGAFPDVNAFSTAVNALLTVQPAATLPPLDPPSDLVLPKYDICAPTGGPVPIPSDTQTIKDLTATIDITNVAKAYVDDLCQSIVVFAGEGTNLVPCIAAIIIDEAAALLAETKDLLTFCDSNASQAEVTAAYRNSIIIDTDISKLASNTTNQFAGVTNQLTAIGASITSHTSAIDTDLTNQVFAVDSDISNRLSSVETDLMNQSTAIDTDINNHLNQVDADILARATQIDNEISAFQTLEVRTQIEQSLAGGLIIGLFELPQANGGYLEIVRAIVNDTISKLVAAGQSVGGATKYLGLGDTAFSAKQYKSAYAYYLTAYATAVK